MPGTALVTVGGTGRLSPDGGGDSDGTMPGSGVLISVPLGSLRLCVSLEFLVGDVRAEDFAEHPPVRPGAVGAELVKRGVVSPFDHDSDPRLSCFVGCWLCHNMLLPELYHTYPRFVKGL